MIYLCVHCNVILYYLFIHPVGCNTHRPTSRFTTMQQLFWDCMRENVVKRSSPNYLEYSQVGYSNNMGPSVLPRASQNNPRCCCLSIYALPPRPIIVPAVAVIVLSSVTIIVANAAAAASQIATRPAGPSC